MPEGNFTYTYRAQVTKEASLRFISHLDYASLMERAICRAKLPVVYSEGFNPHMKISFASALALGVTSEAEYMEFILSKEICQPEVFERLSAQLPDGATLKALKIISGKHKALMALADEAKYKIVLSDVDDIETLKKAVRDFNKEETSIYLRKTPKKVREIDIKQYVVGDISCMLDSEMPVLEMAVKITPQGSIKPSEVITYIVQQGGLNIEVANADINRTELLCNGKNLMDVL